LLANEGSHLNAKSDLEDDFMSDALKSKVSEMEHSQESLSAK